MDVTGANPSTPSDATPVVAIAALRDRARGRCRGVVRSMRIETWGANADAHDIPVASLTITVADETAEVAATFLGRHRIAGLHLGTWIELDGVVGLHNHRRAFLNPAYDFVVGRD